LQVNYRFLAEKDFTALHAAFLEAFADYIVPFKLSESQLENHVATNAVDLNHSVGAFADGKIVGFSLNGFGRWNGKSTAYDAGTGVIPAFRGTGVAARIFEFMTPALKQSGVEQILLEVITGNEKAVRLYRRLGFRTTRRLLIFEQPTACSDVSKSEAIVREIAAPDWNLLKTFWDGSTSWQNSVEALKRGLSQKHVLGAFIGEIVAGYAVVFPKSGSIAQIAVNKNYRCRGVAAALLSEMKRISKKDKPLHISNVDANLDATVKFLKNRNFKHTLSQFEMIKPL
jgi:ribosomal protein S18 acetylase RimI-like enzyme